jgi:ketosteroid isomerase-like protein
MKHLTITCVALAVAGLAACAKPPAVGTAKIADAVKADAEQVVTEFNARDAAKAVAHDAPDFVGMAHGAPNTMGPAADLAGTKQQMADPALKFAVGDEHVDVAASGEMAVYRAAYVFTFTDPKTKAPVTENGNWVVGYRKQADGAWKMAWDVLSDTGSAPAVKS